MLGRTAGLALVAWGLWLGIGLMRRAIGSLRPASEHTRPRLFSVTDSRTTVRLIGDSRSQDSPTAAVLGRIGLPEPVRALAGAAVGRRRGRGRAQRAGLRGLPGARRPARPGAGGAGAGRRRVHAGGALAGRPDLALRLRRRAAAPAGDRASSTSRATGSAGPRPTAGCSCRSRTAAASSSGTTTSGARRRSGGSRRATSRAGARCTPSSAAPRRAPPRRRGRPLGRAGADARGRSSAGSAATPRRAALLFEWSMVECVERYLEDERLQMAYLGQGVIGTNASPHDPGTASIHFHHASGRMGGHARHVGLRQGRDGHGLVPPLRHRARGGRGGGGGRAGGPDHPGRRGRARGGRADPARRWSSPTPTRARRSALLGDAADPGWASGSGDPDRRAARSSSTWRSASCPTSPPGPAPASRTTWARSTRRSPRTEWRRRSPAGAEGELPAAALDRALLPDRARPERGARRGPHDERLRPVRAAHVRGRGLGHAAARRWRTGARLDRAVLRQPPRARSSTSRCSARRTSSDGSGSPAATSSRARCLPAYMWDRRLAAADADAGRLPLRRLHPSRRQRDRHQRPERRDGGPGEGVSGTEGRASRADGGTVEGRR